MSLSRIVANTKLEEKAGVDRSFDSFDLKVGLRTPSDAFGLKYWPIGPTLAAFSSHWLWHAEGVTLQRPAHFAFLGLGDFSIGWEPCESLNLGRILIFKFRWTQKIHSCPDIFGPRVRAESTWAPGRFLLPAIWPCCCPCRAWEVSPGADFPARWPVSLPSPEIMRWIQMGVSINDGTLLDRWFIWKKKWKTIDKWMTWGYFHFRKPRNLYG